MVIRISKWWLYLIIGVVIFIIMLIIPRVAIQGVFSPDLGSNLLSEFCGLLFTLIVFIGIIEGRDWLEWRPFEKKVKEKIRRQAESLLDIFVGTYYENPYWGERHEDYYPKLLAELKNKVLSNPEKEFKFGGVGYTLIASKEFMTITAPTYETRRRFLSDIEYKYGTHLNAQVRISIMDIQDELEKLILQFQSLAEEKEERRAKSIEIRAKSIETIMQKIIVEIKNLRDNGIDISF